MVRGESSQPKIHYKGEHEDFIIFIDDVKAAESWKTDKSIPLAQVVSSFKIFVTHKSVSPS
jgi:Shwachman-Bodian-Diamond syndrome (SBDS) protein